MQMKSFVTERGMFQTDVAVERMTVSSPKLMGRELTPKVMLLEGGAFGRGSAHEGGTLIMQSVFL